MKKVKIVFWALIIVLLGFFVYQNHSFLFENKEIVFDTYYGTPYKLHQPVAVYFLTFLFLGCLIAYFFNLSERFKSKKIIRELNGRLESERKKTMDLETRLSESSGRISPAYPVNAEIQTEIASS